MSGRLFQSMILQMKDSVNRTIGVIDASGVVVACSDLRRMGEMHEDVLAALSSDAGVAAADGLSYKSFSARGQRFEYAVFVEGEDERSREICPILAVSMSGAKQFYDEKHDKTTFIKNVILDNILPGDIYVKSKELHFGADRSRVVFVLRMVDKVDAAALDVLQGLFPEKQKDFVISVSESDIAVVKEVRQNCDVKDLKKLAKSMEETLNSELLIKTIIGIGTVTPNVKDLALSYKEAQIAIEVGQVFEAEKSIIHYENLGIGRLIYQLPTTLCEMFIAEVFKKGSIDSLDRETLFTIQKFFDNNLNVSETSRKLFVHRNTLVYRLEKIKKLTGLDLREFDHAIIFKVALMVKKYLQSHEAKF